MGGSLMQSAFSLLPPLDRSSLLRGLAFGSLWGAAVASGLICLSFYHCGGIDLLEAADTLSVSLLAGIATIGPVTMAGRNA
jgi:hypothetical protein